ncbi:MAG: lipoate protein ligase C-terminal domain-containing protein [Bacillota bacterium]
MVKEALYRQFIRVYGEKRLDSLPEVRSAGSLDQSTVQKLYQKYASWEWRYGEAPKFDMEISTRFEWGRIEIEMKLEAGIIREAVVYSDTGDGSFISGLSQALIGKTLNAPLIAEGILYMDAGPDKRRMQKDVAQWILAKGF